MTKAKNQIVAFNVGELGAEALARTDLETYSRGAAIMENWLPLVQGGMTKFPGTKHLESTPSNGVALLRPFIFNEEQRFALELSDAKMRLYFEDGLVTLVGATATIGTWSDQSTTIPSGGGSPPDGGTGDIDIDIDIGGIISGVYA